MFFDVFTKTRGMSKPPGSYFPYVGVARWVTKLFRIGEEHQVCSEIQICGNSFRKIRYFSGKSRFFLRKSLNFGEKHTFSEKGRHFCEICENDARFPWVELVDFPKNSLNVYEKRTNSLNVHEERTFSERGCHFCKFCEKDARFPRVEFADFRKIGGWGSKGG